MIKNTAVSSNLLFYVISLSPPSASNDSNESNDIRISYLICMVFVMSCHGSRFIRISPYSDSSAHITLSYMEKLGETLVYQSSQFGLPFSST